MRRRFFVERFTGGKATLEGEAAHHLGRVLRAEPGQLYELSDGREVNLARVERAGKDSIEFTVVENVLIRPRSLEVTLLIAVVKFDRFEWALEKATELGAAEIVPLATARGEKALLAAAPKRAARWRKILFESAQQARCLRPPALLPLSSSAEGFRTAREAAVRILFSERPDATPLRIVFQSNVATAKPTPASPTRFALAIGPEGGWTDAEFASAEAAGFREAALGENILRTETAVVAALAAAQLFWS